MPSESVCQVASSWVDVGSFHTRLVVSVIPSLLGTGFLKQPVQVPGCDGGNAETFPQITQTGTLDHLSFWLGKLRADKAADCQRSEDIAEFQNLGEALHAVMKSLLLAQDGESSLARQ
jgi:hypothetical protein